MGDFEIDITLQDATGWSQKFTSLKNLIGFIDREQIFWEERYNEIKLIHPDINNGYFNTPRSFKANTTQIREILKTQNITTPQTNQRVQDIKSYLNSAKSSWLYSHSSITHHYIDLLKKYSVHTSNAYIQFIINKSTSNIANIDYFKGYMLAYEFENQDIDLVKRRDGERRSLGQIRSNFEETQDQLFGEVDHFKKEFDIWNQQNKLDSEKLYRVHKKLGERNLNSQKENFSQSLDEWKAEFDAQKQDFEDKIKELEATYQEKLKLQKPAEYWNKAASKYDKQGRVWAGLAFSWGFVGLLLFGYLLSLWIANTPIKMNLSSLQGAVLFATLAAMFAYTLKLLSRMAFSSFHLMRDAEEREQLTYLYLALTHESEIDKDSRDILLQALFSRSETGLLSNESGPTMPGIQDILRNSKS